MRQLIYLLLDLRCVLCKMPLYQSLSKQQKPNGILCEKCTKLFQRTEHFHCKQCGEPTEKEGLCQRCSAERHNGNQPPVPYDDYRFLYPYEEHGKQLVLLHKKSKRHEILKLYASFLTDETISPIQLNRKIPITFVPDSNIRKWKKGRCCFSSQVAKYLKQQGYQIKEKLIKKSFFSKMQKLKNREERLESVEKIFTPSKMKKRAKEMAGPIQLIDDVYTTGATITRCAAILKESGFSPVYVVTIFKSHFK